MLYLIESQLSKAKDSYQEINKIKGDIIPKVDQIAEIPVVIASSNPNLEVEDDIQKALIVEDNTENISKIK